MSRAIADNTLRRTVDIFAAGLGLLALGPLFGLIAILIKTTSPGPVFYRATRVGREGRLFRLYKFRSMVVNADRTGPGITAAGDARITASGRWLRRLKLDELPQLINILKGEMSLVGPRPEDPRYVAHYTPAQRAVLEAPPGLTSPASVHYRAEEDLLTGPNWETTYLQVVLPDKLQIELDYLKHRTIFSDLVVILQTARAVFRLS